MRRALILVGALGVVLGGALVLRTQAGWVVLISGLVTLSLGLGRDFLLRAEGDLLRAGAGLAFLVLAAFFVHMAFADSAKGDAGGVFLNVVLAAGLITVVLGSFLNMWAQAAVKRGHRGRMTIFLSRHMRGPER